MSSFIMITIKVLCFLIYVINFVDPLPLYSNSSAYQNILHVLDEVPLIDGHNDLPHTLYDYEKNQINNFDLMDLKINPKWSPMNNSHTDILRLRQGKVGGQFWVAYCHCKFNNKDATERTLEQIDVIKRYITKYSNDFKYVTTADGIMEAFKEKKIASMIQVEGGHAIDSRLAVLRLFYELGVRAMTLTHGCNTPWADASPIDDTNEPKKNLTEWGKKVIWEMNRLGMIVDISHVSEGVMDTVLDNSKAPVIFSHSSAYTIQNHHRNVKDHILRKLKKNNGIIMINFYTTFIGGNTTEKVIEHINHVKEIIGPDHIGIGGDYNGVRSVPEGLDDVSKYPELFNKLAETGWNRDDLKKLAGLNFIRVFKDVERVRDDLEKTPVYEELIEFDAINTPEIRQCRMDVDSYKN